MPITEFAKTCHKTPTLLSYRGRCGKPNCHCATGDGHGPYWYLRWRDSTGKHCRRYVRAADVDAVRAVVETRRADRDQARRAAAEAGAWLRMDRYLIRDLLDDLDRFR